MSFRSPLPIALDSHCLDQDRPSEIRARHATCPFTAANSNRLRTLEREGASADLHRDAAPDCSKIGTFAHAIRCKHIHSHAAPDEPLGNAVGAHLSIREPEICECRDQRRQDRRTHADVHNQIQILTDARGDPILLQPMKQHHLTADQRPALGNAVGDVQQGIPELRLKRAQRREVQHLSQPGSDPRGVSVRPERCARPQRRSDPQRRPRGLRFARPPQTANQAPRL